MEVCSQTEDSHYLRSNCNIKTILTRNTMRLAAQTDNDIPQFTVIHIDNAFPDDTTRINIQCVALLDMVVQHSAQQHMSRGNSMEVAGKMEIDIFHRYYLRITATCSAAFDAHAGPKRRFTQCYDNLFIQLCQTLGQAYRSSRLTFACRCRRNSGYQDQLTCFLSL